MHELGLSNLVWLIPALPLAGFLIAAAFGPRIGKPRIGYLATGLVFASFVLSLAVLFSLESAGGEHRAAASLVPFTSNVAWISIGSFRVDYTALIDPLSMLMCLIVTGVGGLIHLFAVGYMAEDRDFPRFFTYLNLFIFFMLTLVLGANLLLMFVGWEGVGLCSYLLISFWYEDVENSKAGNKAFIVNRIGDVGFALGVMAVFYYFGTLTFYNESGGGFLDQALKGVTALGPLTPAIATAIALLLFIGACGKSAQFPLYVWLPDAMAGPTPVSALIHAATMVTAGVVMIARVSPIVVQSTVAMSWIAGIGVFTALFAATIALTQNDIKKVLAYSTVSQLGYMFLGCGVGAFSAGMFHVTTHAFFKALLFLGAGSVIHALSGEQDMRKMGGLSKRIPITYSTMAVGWLAIAGIVPLAGFWSKDAILGFAAGYPHAGMLLYVIGAGTALLTAFYMTRLMAKTFWTKQRFDESALGGHGHTGDDAAQGEHDSRGEDADEASHAHGVHESPRNMTVPLMILAGLSAVGGLIGTPWANQFEAFLEPSLPPKSLYAAREGLPVAVGLGLGLALAVAGIWIAWSLYSRHAETGELLTAEEKAAPTPIGELYRGSLNLWGVDALFTWIGVQFGGAFASAMAWFDRSIVDGIVNLLAAITGVLSEILRRTQAGFVRGYALAMLGGVVVVVGAILWPFISR